MLVLVVAHKIFDLTLRCVGIFSCGMGDCQFHDQALNLGSLYWEWRILATGPPGKSLNAIVFNFTFHFSLQAYMKVIVFCILTLYLITLLELLVSPRSLILLFLLYFLYRQSCHLGTDILFLPFQSAYLLFPLLVLWHYLMLC